MKQCFTVLAVVVISFYFVKVNAEEITPISNELKEFLSLSFIINEYKPMSISERKRVAKLLLDRAKDFDAYIPALSPEIRNWVKKELDECKAARCTSLYSSNEFVHLGLKNNSNALVEVLVNLNKAIGTDISLEMYYWSLAATFFRDRSIFEDYERLGNLSYLKFNHELGATRAKLIGAAINSGIIRQYLQAQILAQKG